MSGLLVYKRNYSTSRDSRNTPGKQRSFNNNNHSWLSLSQPNLGAHNYTLAIRQKQVAAFYEGQFENAIESDFNNSYSLLSISQQNQSGRSDSLATTQQQVAAFHEGQNDVAIESIPCQAANFGDNHNGTFTATHSTNSTASSAHSNDGADRQVFLGRGAFTNSPGNREATNFICGSRSAQYKQLQNREKKHFVHEVHKAMVDMGFTFVVVNQDGSPEEVDHFLAMEYVLRKLREGEITAEERRQKRARCKNNRQQSLRPKSPANVMDFQSH